MVGCSNRELKKWIKLKEKGDKRTPKENAEFEKLAFKCFTDPKLNG